MKEILIISGKGGTGKTSLAASLAALTEDVIVADCDVDAPDLHLLLKPSIRTSREFIGGKKPVKDYDKCAHSGCCARVCKFNAITADFRIDPIACEGCGVCAWNCPSSAITMKDSVSGTLFISDIKTGTMVHALLKPGEENSGKLVSEVKKTAKQLAEKENKKFILIDGSPGIGCPVLASLTGVYMAVIVTEPTVSGIHDLERVISLCEHFKVPVKVIINKSDINEKKADEIADFCCEKKIDIMARIPFSDSLYEALVKGKTVVEYAPDCPASVVIRDIGDKIWKM